MKQQTWSEVRSFEYAGERYIHKLYFNDYDRIEVVNFKTNEILLTFNSSSVIIYKDTNIGHIYVNFANDTLAISFIIYGVTYNYETSVSVNKTECYLDVEVICAKYFLEALEFHQSL